MSGTALAASAGLCAAAACLVAVASTVPPGRRSTRLDDVVHVTATQHPAAAPVAAHDSNRSSRVAPRPSAIVRRVGTWLRTAVGAPVDDAAAAVAGSIALVATPLALVDLRLGAVAAMLARMRPILASRRRRLAHERLVVGELPEVIDLLHLGLASGGSTLMALRAVVARPTGPVTEALADVIARVAAGHRMADALEEVPAALGEASRPLVRALVSSERYGVELGPALHRLAHDAREDRRRRAQARARRVPVQMLLPLVTCILPAFVVLTLVPTLVATFRTLEL